MWAAALTQNIYSKAHLKTMFKTLSLKGDGVISVSNIQHGGGSE
jgi:hypothetical protein